MSTKTSLDANGVRQALPAGLLARLAELEVFQSIGSTNTYLLGQPPPEIGRFRAALTDDQTSGRGRHNRRWLSPRGSGLCVSVAYTFGKQPGHLPVLTLALGAGIVTALDGLGIAGVKLKWPNDIFALGAKLGGMLTEVQSTKGTGVTVVAGIGLNIDLPEQLRSVNEPGWAHRAIDLKTIVADYPPRELLAAGLISALIDSAMTFEESGFGAFSGAWQRLDWLRGRDIVVDLGERQITGVAAGIDSDGALLVDAEGERVRVISGSITMAVPPGGQQ
jgi:BirA family biotin operon repressor/biotin-[acetyl-CoA-carboxylase] ligase